MDWAERGGESGREGGIFISSSLVFSSSLGLFLSTFSFVSSPKLSHSHSHSHSHSLFVSSLHFVCASIEKEKKRAKKTKELLGRATFISLVRSRAHASLSSSALQSWVRERETSPKSKERKKRVLYLLIMCVRSLPRKCTWWRKIVNPLHYTCTGLFFLVLSALFLFLLLLLRPQLTFSLLFVSACLLFRSFFFSFFLVQRVPTRHSPFYPGYRMGWRRRRGGGGIWISKRDGRKCAHLCRVFLLFVSN